MVGFFKRLRKDKAVEESFKDKYERILFLALGERCCRWDKSFVSVYELQILFYLYRIDRPWPFSSTFREGKGLYVPEIDEYLSDLKNRGLIRKVQNESAWEAYLVCLSRKGEKLFPLVREAYFEDAVVVSRLWQLYLEFGCKYTFKLFIMCLALSWFGSRRIELSDVGITESEFQDILKMFEEVKRLGEGLK